jgi:hypothetical protein
LGKDTVFCKKTAKKQRKSPNFLFLDINFLCGAGDKFGFFIAKILIFFIYQNNLFINVLQNWLIYFWL